MDSESEKLRRADRVAEKAMEEAFAAIWRAFRQVDLSEREKAYVRDAGQKLSDQAISLLIDSPDAAVLRPFIAAFAIATIVGPSLRSVEALIPPPAP